jgi:uncharacterized membrane protein YeiH
MESAFSSGLESLTNSKFFAAILKAMLVSLITGLSLKKGSPWWHGAGYELLYCFAFALVVFLAKGAFKSMDAPYVVPSGVIMGLITGVARCEVRVSESLNRKKRVRDP